ncbi:MAG: hypothetical protein IIC75_00545 [Bacteroidetes bacterium]|nr:hypothetical protein [Bacteroidota bacterium]
MTNIKFKNILIWIILLVTNVTIAQSIKKIEPTSGVRGSNFSVTITGLNTHWKKSPNSKMEIFFSDPDIVHSGLSIQDDTTITTKFWIASNAKLGSRILNLKYSSLSTPEYIIIDSSFTIYEPIEQPIPD